MSVDLLVSSIATALLAAAPVLIVASGELLSETVGIYNIGVEGSMLAGALGAFIAAQETDSWGVGVLAGMAVGAVASCLFGVVVNLGADIVVAGLALVFLANGLTGMLGDDYVRQPAESVIPTWNVPLLSDIPYVGEAAFQQPLFVYAAFLAPVLVWLILTRTRHGLALRSIGEDPAAVDAAGVAVNRWRLVYVSVGGAFAGMGGAFLSLGVVATWLQGMTAGEGWIAIAIVMVASWRSLPLIPAAFLYGALGTLGNVAQALGWSVPSEVFSALPYLGTLALVCVLAWYRIHTTGRLPWPGALGQVFTRGAS